MSYRRPKRPLPQISSDTRNIIDVDQVSSVNQSQFGVKVQTPDAPVNTINNIEEYELLDPAARTRIKTTYKQMYVKNKDEYTKNLVDMMDKSDEKLANKLNTYDKIVQSMNLTSNPDNVRTILLRLRDMYKSDTPKGLVHNKEVELMTQMATGASRREWDILYEFADKFKFEYPFLLSLVEKIRYEIEALDKRNSVNP
jgi:hypothetical protein